jgi:malonyl-CoA O-methyltransferase
LLGSQGWRDWRRLLGAWPRDGDGRLPATFEVVYGHAWKPEPRQIADGRAVVKFHSR